MDSAIVRMAPRPAGERTAQDEAMLAHVVSSAFSQRRKMLRNNLKGILGDTGFEELGIAPTARAEDLSVADYIRMANALVV